MGILRLTLSVVGFAVVLAGQDKPLRLNVDVRSVSVDVGAFDSSGRPLINLSKEDFRLLEDGVPQELVSFEPVSTPYNVLVLFDCSGSTIAAQPLFSDATTALSQYLRPQDDLTVAAFGTKITLLLDRKSGTRQTLSSIWRTCGETVFYDALRWGVDRIQKVSGRKGIIVFTDGRDSDAEKRGTIDGVQLSVMKPIENERKRASRKARNGEKLLRAIDAAIVIDRAERQKRSELVALKGRYERLTPREREVLPFVVAGFLNKQTAGELGTSEITIGVHRGQVMRKMGARSLAELVRFADKLGIKPHENL